MEAPVAAAGEIDSAIFSEIGIVAHCLTYLAVAADNYFIVFAKHLIMIGAVDAVAFAHFKGVGNVRGVSEDQFFHFSSPFVKVILLQYISKIPSWQVFLRFRAAGIN